MDKRKSSSLTVIKNRSLARGLPMVLLTILLVQPTTAHAYVDPGSGSAIVTAILGFFAAIGYTFRKFFYSLKRKGSGESTDSNEKPASAADSGTTPDNQRSGSSSDA